MHWQEMLDSRRFAALKRWLSNADLAPLCHDWKGLQPLEKITVFKLMKPAKAMEVFHQLPFEERYFLFGAFDLGSMAPILEDLPSRTRALFHQLPNKRYEEMLECTS